MLEVREVDSGLWVGNGERRVFISEERLNTHDSLLVLRGHDPEGKLIYTKRDPLKVGNIYRSGDITPANRMVVKSSHGGVYQYFTTDGPVEFGQNVWVQLMHHCGLKELPSNSYTILDLGETND